MGTDRSLINRIAVPAAGPAAAALFLGAAWLGGLTGFVAGIAVIAFAVAVVFRVQLRRAERELATMRATLAEFDVAVAPMASASLDPDTPAVPADAPDNHVTIADPPVADDHPVVVGVGPVPGPSAVAIPEAEIAAAVAGDNRATTIDTDEIKSVCPSVTDDDELITVVVPAEIAAGNDASSLETTPVAAPQPAAEAVADSSVGEVAPADATTADIAAEAVDAHTTDSATAPSLAPAPDAMPDVEVLALSGVSVRTGALGDPDGRPAVVVLWRPDCGPSARLTPELIAWASLQGPRLIVIAACDAPTAFRAGLPGMVLLDPAFQVGRALGAAGTPAAISLDGDGRPTTGLISGVAAINAHLVDAMRAWASTDPAPAMDVPTPADETAPTFGPPVPLAMLLRRVEQPAAPIDGDEPADLVRRAG